MDVLKRILELKDARHWTEYQLAEEAGMTQSTISSWYRKDMVPTIPSIEKICDAFGISLSQFFADESSHLWHLTDQQLDLIKATEKLNSEQIDALLHFIDTL